jgi:hypothetical protein
MSGIQREIEPGEGGAVEPLVRLRGRHVMPISPGTWNDPEIQRWLNTPKAERKIVGILARPADGKKADLGLMRLYISTEPNVQHVEICGALRESGVCPELPDNETLLGRESFSAPELVVFGGSAKAFATFENEHVIQLAGVSLGLAKTIENHQLVAQLPQQQVLAEVVQVMRKTGKEVGKDLDIHISSL